MMKIDRIKTVSRISNPIKTVLGCFIAFAKYLKFQNLCILRVMSQFSNIDTCGYSIKLTDLN